MIAHLPNIVKVMNAKIHVLTLFVAVKPTVRLKHTEQYVNVLPVYKVTHQFLVQKLGAPQALNVPTMKNVITLPLLLREKNANLCAGKNHALPALLAQQIITGKSVLATTLFKEMDMSLVQNVSKYFEFSKCQKYFNVQNLEN